MSIRKNALSAVLAMAVLTLLLGVIYPLFITGVSQTVFPGNANGQKVYMHGRLVGSKIIGQPFVDAVLRDGRPQMDKNGNPVTKPDPRYFQTRPSATVPADNAATTTFSNLGPNNLTTEQEIAANVKSYLALNTPYDSGLTVARVPVDAANSSGSGIDPDISLANAQIQAHRIAAVRRLPYRRVLVLVSKYTSRRQLGIFGEPAVNVVELNLALDRPSGAG
jgi:potassium-transporting ATPase KdpC subunit